MPPLTPASPHTAASATSADGEESVPAVGGSHQWLLLSRPKPRRSYPGPTGACGGGCRSCCALTPASSALQHLCLPSVLTSLLAIYHLSLICHPSVCLIYLCIGSKVKLDSCACFSKIESSTSEPRASPKGREKKVGLGTRDLVLNYRGIGSAEDVSLNVC